jgi:hypothetical protein
MHPFFQIYKQCLNLLLKIFEKIKEREVGYFIVLLFAELLEIDLDVFQRNSVGTVLMSDTLLIYSLL